MFQLPQKEHLASLLIMVLHFIIIFVATHEEKYGMNQAKLMFIDFNLDIPL